LQLNSLHVISTISRLASYIVTRSIQVFCCSSIETVRRKIKVVEGRLKRSVREEKEVTDGRTLSSAEMNLAPLIASVLDPGTITEAEQRQWQHID